MQMGLYCAMLVGLSSVILCNWAIYNYDKSNKLIAGFWLGFGVCTWLDIVFKIVVHHFS